MGAVWVALIVLTGTIVSPSLLAFMTNRQRRAERLEDYARQDQVADRAAKLRQEERTRQDEVAAQLLASNERFAIQAAVDNRATQGQLAQIHTLVNSKLTEAMHSQHEAMVRALLLMKEVAALRLGAGLESSKGEADAIAHAQRQVDELGADIKDRLEQTRVANVQAEEQAEAKA